MTDAYNPRAGETDGHIPGAPWSARVACLASSMSHKEVLTAPEE